MLAGEHVPVNLCKLSESSYSRRSSRRRKLCADNIEDVLVQVALKIAKRNKGVIEKNHIQFNSCRNKVCYIKFLKIYMRTLFTG